LTVVHPSDPGVAALFTRMLNAPSVSAIFSLETVT